jgi:hypothetical protein
MWERLLESENAVFFCEIRLYSTNCKYVCKGKKANCSG